MEWSILWYAAFPFSHQSKKLLSSLGITMQQVVSEYPEAVKRAKDRLFNAIKGKLSISLFQFRNDPLSELLSYPVSRAIVNFCKDEYINRRTADYESKRMYFLSLKIFEVESEENYVLLDLAKNTFSIDMYCEAYEPPVFKMFITDFLHLTSIFNAEKWRLVNRVLKNGFVYITKREAWRLLSEALRRKLLTNKKHINTLPEELLEIANELKQKAADIKTMYTPAEVDPSLLPPCMQKIKDNLNSATSHQARFALVSFLLAKGWSPDDILSLFSEIPDFNPERTKYQILHIAGELGGRKRYSPPSCDTMVAWGLCPGRSLCGNIKHPLEWGKSWKKKKTGK